MTRESIETINKTHWKSLRAKDLTSTDIQYLFGRKPAGLSTLWHEKRLGVVPDRPATEQMVWGNKLEWVIGQGVAERRGWTIRPMKEYMRIPELRMGSSFDCSIEDPAGGVMEIKLVGNEAEKREWHLGSNGHSWDGWIDRMPTRVELQVQHQLLVSGRDSAVVCAFWNNRTYLTERRHNTLVQDEILRRAAMFWRSVATGQVIDMMRVMDMGVEIPICRLAQAG